VFTPDGQWLLTGSADDYCLWEVGSWSSVFRLARDRAGDMYGSMAVSPDSRLAAVLRGRNAGLQLVSIPEGRELAFLETGEPLCFSPDGTLLTTAGEDHRTLLVWDLRLIRSELRALKLDWD
jgi:WD40 repeat protein